MKRSLLRAKKAKRFRQCTTAVICRFSAEAVRHQGGNRRQTETKASKALDNPNSDPLTLTLAGSVTAQSRRTR